MSDDIYTAIKAAADNGHDPHKNPYLWSSDTSNAYFIACAFGMSGGALRSLRKTRGHLWIANFRHTCLIEGTPEKPVVTFKPREKQA